MSPARAPFAIITIATLMLTLAACGGGSSGSKTPAPTVPEVLGGPSELTATLRVSSASAATGADATVQLQALGLGDPGLGAWTVDVEFDNTVVSAKSCSGDQGGTPSAQSGGNPISACNVKYDDRTVRVNGATGLGILGDIDLGTIVFTCNKAGTSPLKLSTTVFADGTIGNPLDITPTIEDGTITCS